MLEGSRRIPQQSNTMRASSFVVSPLPRFGYGRSVPGAGSSRADDFVGANVGTAKESLRTGPLAQLQDNSLATRATARAAHGWIMDIYLIRKT